MEFFVDDIVKITRTLDQSKVYGHDEISRCMIKLCASSTLKSLHLIYRNCLETDSFPKEWKKANINPLHKSVKQLITNYRPVSPFPICGKVFEKIIFNSLFVNLLNSNQSGFRPGDSYVHQLITITHGIYKAVDAILSLGVRGVFLNLYKAFDKV